VSGGESFAQGHSANQTERELVKRDYSFYTNATEKESERAGMGKNRKNSKKSILKVNEEERSAQENMREWVPQRMELQGKRNAKG